MPERHPPALPDSVGRYDWAGSHPLCNGEANPACVVTYPDPENAAAVVVVNKESRPHVKHTVITGSVAEKEEWTELILATANELMATQSCGTLLFRPARPVLKGSA